MCTAQINRYKEGKDWGKIGTLGNTKQQTRHISSLTMEKYLENVLEKRPWFYVGLLSGYILVIPLFVSQFQELSSYLSVMWVFFQLWINSQLRAVQNPETCSFCHQKPGRRVQ